MSTSVPQHKQLDNAVEETAEKYYLLKDVMYSIVWPDVVEAEGAVHAAKLLSLKTAISHRRHRHRRQLVTAGVKVDEGGTTVPTEVLVVFPGIDEPEHDASRSLILRFPPLCDHPLWEEGCGGLVLYEGDAARTATCKDGHTHAFVSKTQLLALYTAPSDWHTRVPDEPRGAFGALTGEPTFGSWVKPCVIGGEADKDISTEPRAVLWRSWQELLGLEVQSEAEVRSARGAQEPRAEGQNRKPTAAQTAMSKGRALVAMLTSECLGDPRTTWVGVDVELSLNAPRVITEIGFCVVSVVLNGSGGVVSRHMVIKENAHLREKIPSRKASGFFTKSGMLGTDRVIRKGRRAAEDKGSTYVPPPFLFGVTEYISLAQARDELRSLVREAQEAGTLVINCHADYQERVNLMEGQGVLPDDTEGSPGGSGRVIWVDNQILYLGYTGEDVEIFERISLFNLDIAGDRRSWHNAGNDSRPFPKRFPPEIEIQVMEGAVDAGHAVPWKLANLGPEWRGMVFTTASLWPQKLVRDFVKKLFILGKGIGGPDVAPDRQLAGYLRALVIASVGRSPTLSDLRGAAQLLYEIESNVGEQAAERACGNAGAEPYEIPYSPLAQANFIAFELLHRALGSPDLDGPARELEDHEHLTVGAVLEESLRILHRTDAPVDCTTFRVSLYWWRSRSICPMSFVWVHRFDVALDVGSIDVGDVLLALRALRGIHIDTCLNYAMQMTAEYVIRVKDVGALVAIMREVERVYLVSHVNALVSATPNTRWSQLIGHDVLRNVLSIARALLYVLPTERWIGLLCVSLFRVLDTPSVVATHWSHRIHAALRRFCCAALVTQYHEQMHERAVSDDEVAARASDGNIFAQYLLALVRTLPCSTEAPAFSVSGALNFEAILALAIAAQLAPGVVCVHVKGLLEWVWGYAEGQLSGGPDSEEARHFCSSGMGYMTPGWRWDYSRSTIFPLRDWKYYAANLAPYPANMWHADSEPWASMLRLVNLAMPALLDLNILLVCSTIKTVQGCDYGLAMRHLREFVGSAAGAQLRSLIIAFDDRRQRSASPALVWDMVSWEPVPLSKATKAFRFKSSSFVSDFAEGLDVAPLWLLPLDSYVEEFATSVSDFVLVNPAMWSKQRYLTSVLIETDKWLVSEQPRASARAFACALDRAAVGWRETLTVLSLDGIPVSVGSCLALSGLSALRQLDLHPKLVDSSDLRTFDAPEKLEEVGQTRLLFLSTRGLGDEVHVVSLADDAAGELLSMLRLFLPELGMLEVMHVGGYSELGVQSSCERLDHEDGSKEVEDGQM
ncbi:hypothetical protein AURDEDRAFT_124925 [Auricularia subglabra TFB-10046 SS5]|nr:hypothetical protein AURDEDRAFT_124925 [Auricularia subglabra TFB-10046 SS5]